jgi:SAM-dependent MidA family methyltransferase
VLADVLRDPGSADITAGVDFGAIVRRAERGGLKSLGLASQRDALLALGFAEWNEVQLDRQGSLLAQGKGGWATRVWEGRGQASLLVDPEGLGRQKWLLLATADLTAPPWLVQALAGRRPTDVSDSG